MISHHLENFIREAQETIARASDPKLAVDAVGENLRRLMLGSVFLDEARLRVEQAEYFRHVLFADDKLSVVACIFAPGQSTPIHDHPSWGIVAAVSRRLLATTWRRIDDGLTPGFASLNEATRTLVTETSFHILRPPEESVHRLENPYREPALTLHVFGGDGASPATFDVKDKLVVEQTGDALKGI